MKKLKSLPENEEFFANYIWLVKTLNIAGYGGQVVSALTEVGGIFVAAHLSLKPILGEYAFYFAAVIAVLGTAIIEVGLRHSIPHSVDAILYRRFTGLRLAISVFVMALTALLLYASGILSFKNSTKIVEGMTVGAKEEAIRQADSLYLVAVKLIDTTAAKEEQAIALTYEVLAEGAAAAEAGKVASAEQNLKNWKNRQWREKTSFGGQIDNAKMELQTAMASLAEATADINREKAEKLEALKNSIEAKRKNAKAEHEKAINQAAAEQTGKVNEYGGGLAYFTIICLFLLIVSITVNRIVIKGSGVKEQVEVSQYDLLPHPLIAAYNAFAHRVSYIILSRVLDFDDKTPSLKVPDSVREIFDPSEVKNQRAKLKIEDGDNSEYIVKRKRIRAFGEGSEPDASAQDDNNLPYYALNQRYKDYRKRVSSHLQKAKVYERKGEPVPERTKAAIENNLRWRDHYKALMDNYKA